MYRIKNSQMITPDSILEGYDVIIKNDRIEAIMPSCGYHKSTEEVIDAKGAYLMPGLIDLHSDYIEFIASPRPTSVMDFDLVIRSCERELVSHGITTMFHSLSLCQHKADALKPIRQPKHVERLMQAITKTHEKSHLMRHRFHARMEMDNVAYAETLIAHIQSGQVDLLSFMDHTPGQGQYRDVEGYKKIAKGYGALMTDEAIIEMIQKRQEQPKLSLDTCKKIAKVALQHQIAIASHDDDSIDKLVGHEALSITISEFPITMAVAKSAFDRGLHTMVGAPNILLGGSHSGNLAAHEAVAAGVVTILCSDYYPLGLLHAVFKLHYDYGHDLEDMVRLVTINPAKAVKMDHIVGSIEVGKKADLLLVKILEDGLPVVEKAFVDGLCVMRTQYRTMESRGL